MRDYFTDHCGLSTLTNAEIEEMDATMAGVFPDEDMSFDEAVEWTEEVSREWAEIEMAWAHIRTI